VKQGLKPGDEVAMDPMGLLTEEEKQEFFGAGSSGDGKSAKDWGEGKKAGGPAAGPGGAPGVPGGPPGAVGKGKAKGGAGKAKGKGGAFGALMKNMTDEEKQTFRSGTPEEKKALLESKGISPDMIEGMMKGGGGRGAGGGAGGPGGGSPEDRQKFMQASPEEQRKILESRGMTPDQIDGLMERMKSGGGGGGGFRGGPPGGGSPQ
jgi:HlyD family secretion protein